MDKDEWCEMIVTRVFRSNIAWFFIAASADRRFFPNSNPWQNTSKKVLITMGAGPNVYAVETYTVLHFSPYTVFHSLLYTAGSVVYRNHIHQHLCNSIVSVHVYHFRMAWDGSQKP